jgi:hypothetical protein
LAVPAEQGGLPVLFPEHQDQDGDDDRVNARHALVRSRTLYPSELSALEVGRRRSCPLDPTAYASFWLSFTNERKRSMSSGVARDGE